MARKSFFSLDRHVQTDIPLAQYGSFFKKIFVGLFRIPKRPIMTLSEAKTAWGIGTASEVEVEAFSIRRLHAGMIAGVLFAFLLFLTFYNFYNDSFGLLSCLGYTLAILASFCVCSVCLWQSDMLHSKEFTPYSQYMLQYKWLFSLVLFVSVCAMQYEAALAADKVDLPDMTVQNASDLSSIFVGHIIGGPWTQYVSSGTADSLKGLLYGGPGAMGTVLCPILGCLNTGALLFVSGFAVYIFTFGSVQVAHTGDWKDSQLFSTFWSPIRTTGAIALCSPLTNSISLLQHLILVAIAMSINLANNVSNEFTKYLVSDSALYSLGTPTMSTGKDHFSKIFSALLNGAVLQVVGKNIHGENISQCPKGYTSSNGLCILDNNPNAQKSPTVTSNPLLSGKLFGNQEDLSIKNRVRTISVAPPGSYYTNAMPSIELAVANTQSGNDILNAYSSAIQEMYSVLYAMTEKYIAQDINKRKEFGEMKNDLMKAYDGFTEKIKNNTLLHIGDNLAASQAATIVRQLQAGTNEYGWLTLGIYPFIISKLQGDLQTSVDISVKIKGDISLKDFKNSNIGGHGEYEIIGSYLNEVREKVKELMAMGYYYDTNYAEELFTSGDSPLERMSYKLLTYTGLNPRDLIVEFQTYNAVAVLYSKGWLCIKSAKTMLSALNTEKNISVINIASRFTGGETGELENSPLNQELESWRPIIIVICGVLFMFGICCMFVLPALPIIFWGRAAVSWAVLIVQTLMGAPFWAASHVLPEGVGLAGQHARKGYLLLLDVFLRPCLLVCGAIMVMLLVETWTKVFTTIYFLWAEHTMTSMNASVIGIFFTTGVILYSIYITIRWLYIQAIGEFPQRVIQWCGGTPADGGTQDVVQNIQAMTGKMQEVVNRMGGGGFDAGNAAGLVK